MQTGKINVEKLLIDLRELEELIQKKTFKDINACGSGKATNHGGKLIYVKKKSNAKEVELVNDISAKINSYISIIKKLLKLIPTVSTRKAFELKKKINSSIFNMKNYAFENGFYGKGLILSKMLNVEFKVDEFDSIERAVVGYATRQIVTGDMQRAKFVKIMQDVFQRGNYGAFAKERGKMFYNKLFNDVTITLKNKTFTMDDCRKALATDPLSRFKA